MGRFVKVQHGWVNLDLVAHIHEVRRANPEDPPHPTIERRFFNAADEQIAYHERGGPRGLLDDLSFYQELIIPAAPGVFALVFDWESNEAFPPREGDLIIQRMPVIAWHFDPYQINTGEFHAPEPVLPDIIDDYLGVAIEMPDGRYIVQATIRCDNMIHLMRYMHELAVNAWHRAHKPEDEK